MANGKMTPEQAAAAWDEEASGMDMDTEVRRHLPLYGAQSFEEIEIAHVEQIEEKRLSRLNIYFMLILGNIVSNPDIDVETIGSRLHAAVADYGRKLNRLNDGIAPVNANDDSVIIPKKKEGMKRKAPIKRENGLDFPAKDYAYVPDPLSPSTWKLRLAEVPGRVTVTQLGRAAAALSPGGFRGNRVDVPVTALSAVKRRILAEYRRLGVSEGQIPMSVKETKAGGQFTVWKEKGTDRYRWMAVYSNNFMDRDNPPEIISEKSHKTFVQMVDEGIVDYPELWHWHLPGTAWGKADMVDFVDGFAIAVGTVYPGHEKEALALSGRTDLGVSHGMPFSTLLYDPTNPGVIDFHVTREISVLPRHAVANPLTDFVVLGEPEETNMGIKKEKRDWLIHDVGLSEDMVENLERNLKELGSLASDIGLASKEAEDDYEDEYEDEYEEEYEDDEDADIKAQSDEDEDVEYDADELDEDEEPQDTKARSSRRPRARDKGRPQGGSSGRGRDKGYLWTSGSKKKPSSFAAGKKKPSSFARDDEKPSSFAGGKKKPSSFARDNDKPSSFAERKRKPMKKMNKEQTQVAEEYVTREEVAEAFAEVLNPIMETLNTFGNALKEMGTLVKELHEEDAERIAQVKEQTPTASLSALIERQIAIGRDEAKLDGRTQLAKEGPVEAEAQTPMYTPVSFVNGLMKTAMSGNGAQAQS